MIYCGGFYEKYAENGVCAVVCAAIEESGVADHLFTTRLGGVSEGCFASMNLTTATGDSAANVAENLRRLLPAVSGGQSRVCHTHQVHGDVILPVTEANAAGFAADPPDCDGLMTDEAGLLLVGKFADCVPVLLCDTARRVCAVVHAGWRGTVQRIAEKAVLAMESRFGTRPCDCIAAVGPSIGPCCFLTHDDVADAARARLGALAEPYLAPAPDGRTHVDLKQINAALLSGCGVGAVYVCGDCTCCHPDKYFSHRRDGLLRGSLAALIQLRH